MSEYGNILVTTATGGLGSSTIRCLLASNVPSRNIFAQVRNLNHKLAIEFAGKGVKLCQADYSDLNSMEAAMCGKQTVVFISTGAYERSEQHRNVIEAIRKNGEIKYLIYSSFIRCDEYANNNNYLSHNHYWTEEAVIKTGIPYTIFRPSYFPEYILEGMIRSALDEGVWDFPGGSAKVNLVARADAAEALARLVIDSCDDTYKNQTLEIGSGQCYTFQDVAQILSEIIGKPIAYRPMPFECYEYVLKEEGRPADEVKYMVACAYSVFIGQCDLIDSCLMRILGRKPKTMKEYLPSLF